MLACLLPVHLSRVPTFDPTLLGRRNDQASGHDVLQAISYCHKMEELLQNTYPDGINTVVPGFVNMYLGNATSESARSTKCTFGLRKHAHLALKGSPRIKD